MDDMARVPDKEQDTSDSPRLIQLKNLGASSVNILNAIGIRTQAELAAIGSVRAYRLIRQRGFRVTHAMLYAMEAALPDVPWQTLDLALKQQLVQLAERIEREEREMDARAAAMESALKSELKSELRAARKAARQPRR